MIASEYSRAPFLVAANLMNFVADGFSQVSRGNIISQVYKCADAVINPQNCYLDMEVSSNIRANMFGKVKAGLQNVSHLAYFTYLGFHNQIDSFFNRNVKEEILYGISTMLLASAAVGAVGAVKRLRKKSYK